ncbi:ZPR1 zinc finger domain-containing protein [Candidatus Woesearchaeota archaeon]|nr:hypothetical protein [uncultured archaeon]AQS32258.1 hypothetical protein [uncultured archaeon]MBS3149376.1 ZPR1 zinc finger domain-containing protein [Candidatus Woesearchaeota archaeon]
MEELNQEICPFCLNKTLILREELIDIPYFGKTYVFSMSCQDSDCNYFKADVEAEEKKDPCKITFTIKKEDDLSIRVVKSSEATVKVPQLRMSVTPGPSSNGYVSNVEGILNRFKKILEDERDLSDDDSVRKHAKNLLKKLWKVKTGDMELKIVIEDPSGNSAILSKDVVVEKLKV